MTEEKLQEIRERIRIANDEPLDTLWDARIRRDDAPALLAEVDRLRAENPQQDRTILTQDRRLYAVERENAVLREYLDKLLIVLVPSARPGSPTS